MIDKTGFWFFVFILEYENKVVDVELYSGVRSVSVDLCPYAVALSRTFRKRS